MRPSLRSALRTLQQLVSSTSTPPGTVPGPSTGQAPGWPTRTSSQTSSQPLGSDYPGDATTPPDMTYTPHADGVPDPGEVVWAWVPYEEDHRQGKDRPALIIGREGAWLIGLQLTSQDHDRDAEQERAAGRLWVDVGIGGWDSQGRPSEVRVNRLIRLDPDAVRREGAALPRDRFDEVAAAVRAAYA